MAALDFPSSPTVGQVYTANGRSWQWDGVSWISYNTLIAAGSNTQIQFNNSGAFGASAGLTWNGTTLTTTGLNNTGNTTLGDANTDTLTINGTAVSIPNNLNFDSNTLFIDAANNTVGIGTNTPAQLLDVVGGVIGSRGANTGARSAVWAQQNDFYSAPTYKGTSIYTWGSAATGTDANIARADLGSLYFQNLSNALIWSNTSIPLIIANNAGVETMRVTAAGNVGIGTSSPTYKVDVSGTIRSNVASNSYAFLVDNGTYSGGLIPSTSTGGLILYNAVAQPLGFWTNNVERMRIDSSGNLGLGVTPSAWTTSGCATLQIKSAGFSGLFNDTHVSSNAYFDGSTWRYIASSVAATNYYQSAGTHVWRNVASGTAGNALTFNTTMTLDASGNLLVGATSQINGERLGVSQPNNNNGLIVNCSNASFSNTAIVARCARTTTNNTYKAYVLNNITTGDLFYVTDGGRVYGSGTYVDLSDVRHKENIRAIDVGLETVLCLKPRRFDWREGRGDGQKNKLGFIAQEVAQVLPDVVTDWKTGDEAFMGIAFAEIIPVLTKAIQELHAEIETLKQRIH